MGAKRIIFPENPMLNNEFIDVIESWLTVSNFEYVHIEVSDECFCIGDGNSKRKMIERELEIAVHGKMKVSARLRSLCKFDAENKKQFELLVSFVKIIFDFDFMNEFYDHDKHAEENKKLKAQLKFCEFSAVNDFRLNCYNEGFFNRTINELIACNKQFSTALFMINDLDKYNVIYGPIEQDKILVEFTKLLNDNYQEGTFVCRLNFNNIVVIGETLNKSEYEAVNKVILKALENCEYTYSSVFKEYDNSSRVDYLLSILSELK